MFNCLRNLHGKVYFYLLAFMSSFQTASKHNVRHYCLWDTDTHTEKILEYGKIQTILLSAMGSSQQPPVTQAAAGTSSEEQLQGGMSSWILGEFGAWLSIFPAEFGRMEWEGTRRGVVVPAQPLPLH